MNIQEENMATIKELNAYGEDMEKILKLRTYPIALKLLESEKDIPEGAIRPKKDRKEHIALCQAYAMSRRQGLTIAMLKEDHWCWNPIIMLGLEKAPEDRSLIFFAEFPSLPYGKYVGIVSAPLKKANFEPDVVLIYCNPAQLRSLVWVVNDKEKKTIKSEFYPIDSCAYDLIPPMLNNEYRITIPDPGEYERAMAEEGEMILSVPKSKLDSLVQGLREHESRNFGYTHFAMDMRPDFPRPPFYDVLFKMWGLDEKK
jgi:uncharacterized protein (DUF169 family)